MNKKDDGSTEVYSLYGFKEFQDNMAAEKGYKQGRFDAIAGQLFRKQFEKIIVYKLIEAIEDHTK